MLYLLVQNFGIIIFLILHEQYLIVMKTRNP